jgi:deoxyribose-phosphate aldolase|tara:strand:- start:1352 stop:2161 length:810 start_codon:yes stop_codon:yes gene_type:complete
MVNILKEEITRIKELLFIKEEDEGLGKYMDSTYLKTSDQAGISDEETDVIIFDTIKDAIDHNMKLVMIRPEYVESARKFIDDKGANLLVGTVIGFPNGDNSLGEKLDEAIQAIEDGVDELDFVVDYKAFKNGELDTIRYEVSEGTVIGVDAGKSVKWIIESAALTSEQIAELTKLISEIVIQSVGVEKAKNVFVKTSTGFFTPEDGSPGGATIDAVSIMSQNAGPLKVKASGGIYSKDDVLNMVNAGASRIGTSAAKEIMLGKETNKDY